MTAAQQDPPAARAWHQALAYAVTGRRLSGLGRQDVPDLAGLTELLRREGADQISGPPEVVPADLMAGIGPAQFWAALTRLRAELRPPSGAAPVLSDRALTADERRLLADVPPHHGS